MTNREEIERRRTFAIISHPDAGKTTLTEKLLLYGGAINQAGSVKGKQSAKHAVSDWMDIEKQRGISVTSSVLQFNYAGKCVNILDTPGHQDFSEDTYRTLMAADSAVMVIDAAKGVEAQTIKLFKVCTLRHIPSFTFINKMDREARDPFELMENIEEILGIKTYPMNWPIGCGKEFKGVFDRNARKVLAFSSDGRANGVKKVSETEAELGDPALDELLTPYLHQQLVDEIELLDGAAEEFDLEKVLRGELSPVFFGSALTNFGVEPFLENFLRLTSAPLARVDSLTGEPVDPCRDEFSAFIFKIQANMNKAHRDRIAFMRICSGKFERGMEAYHVQEGKNIKLATGTQLMAQDRAIVDEAYAGDIIGLFDPGIFSIGDTLCTGKKKVQFAGIPTSHCSQDGYHRPAGRREFLMVHGIFQFLCRIRQTGKCEVFSLFRGYFQTAASSFTICIIQRSLPDDLQPFGLHMHSAILRHHIRCHRQSLYFIHTGDSSCHTVRISLSGQAFIGIPLRCGGHQKPHSEYRELRQALFSMIICLHMDSAVRFHRISHCHFRRRNRRCLIRINDLESVAGLFSGVFIIRRCQRDGNLLPIHPSLYPAAAYKTIRRGPYRAAECESAPSVIIRDCAPERRSGRPIQPLFAVLI